MNKRVKKLVLIVTMVSAIVMIGGCRKESSEFSITLITLPVPCDGITFPTGLEDKGCATIDYVYEVGETEVTWELWKAVYDWATSRKRGSDRYYFQNPGRMGSHDSGDQLQYMTDLHPVTMVLWRDSIVWCNAATEWYNAMTDSSLEPVYRFDENIVRDSRDNNATSCDNVVATVNNGFRLSTSEKWELVARWRTNRINTVAGYSNPWFTKGDSASGAIANRNNYLATSAVAWYYFNSETGGIMQTHSIATRQANSLDFV